MKSPAITADPGPVRPKSIDFTILIPARMQSQRLPGKPLLDLAGKPLIVRVLQCAMRSGAQRVIVATDDERISQAVTEAGGEACMTLPDHASGSDRIAEVVTKLDLPQDAIVVNLQGDEPLMPAEAISQVAQRLAADRTLAASTLAVPLNDIQDVLDPNVVKVVLDRHHRALYFSRAPIPWERENFAGPEPSLPASPTYLRHVGLYAYRAGFLAEMCAQPPCDTEQAERLEQLRILDMGRAMGVEVYPGQIPPGVDTAEDLRRATTAIQTLTPATHSQKKTDQDNNCQD